MTLADFLLKVESCYMCEIMKLEIMLCFTTYFGY